MKTIGFIGGYDKSDLILYVAKNFVAMGKKVLVVDTTALQKTKYIAPTILPAKSYVTDFEDIDIATGFYDYSGIKEYLGMPQHAAFDYDYIFLDIESKETYERYNIKEANKNFFVTGFDIYSIRKGLEIIADLEEPIPLTKVFFSKNITQDEEAYFKYLSLGYKVKWSDDTIYFPFEQGDQSAIIENQRVSKIKFRRLTQLYRESILYMAEQILDDQKENSKLKKAFKQLEKGV